MKESKGKGRSKKPPEEVQWGKEFGQRLRKFRVDENRRPDGTKISQRDFAEFIGASPEQYQKWEQRGAMPVYGLNLLLLKTRITAETLIFGGDAPSTVGLSAQAIRFAEQFDKLPPAKRDELIRMFHVFKEMEKESELGA